VLPTQGTQACENTASNEASKNGRSYALPCLNSTLAMLRDLASRDANAFPRATPDHCAGHAGPVVSALSNWPSDADAPNRVAMYCERPAGAP